MFIYNESRPPLFTIKTENYRGLNGESPPVKIICPKKTGDKIVILYPGASPSAEKHPKMDMLGRMLAKIGFIVFIPRIPPLKTLDISDIGSGSNRVIFNSDKKNCCGYLNFRYIVIAAKAA